MAQAERTLRLLQRVKKVLIWDILVEECGAKESTLQLMPIIVIVAMVDTITELVMDNVNCSLLKF